MKTPHKQSSYWKSTIEWLKGIVHPKMKILSLITHPQVVPKPKTFIFVTQIKIFFVSDPPIDSNIFTTVKAKKGSKDIVKTVHMTSVVLPQFYEITRILFVCKENKKEWLYSNIFHESTTTSLSNHYKLFFSTANYVFGNFLSLQ